MKLISVNVLKVWILANTILWPISLNIFSLNLGLNVIITFIVLSAWIVLRKKIDIFLISALTVFILLFLLSLFISYIGPCIDQYEKMLITGPVLVSLILFGIFLGRVSRSGDWQKLDAIAIFILSLGFLSFFLEMTYPNLFPETWNYRQSFSYSGIFFEPSVVAYSLFPAIAILLCSQSQYSRNIGLCFLVGLLFLSRSSTLIGLIFAWAIYRFSFNKLTTLNIFLAIVFIIGACTFFFVFDEYLNPFIDRVSGIYLGESATNLSSLVYLQGVQDAYLNFIRTYGLGLGFNMMGCNPLPDSFYRDAIDAGLGFNLNSHDGSILISKIVSEAGIFGIMFYIFVIMIWFNNELFIRSSSNKNIKQALIIQNSIIFIFLASSFLRSNGYFSGTFLLFVVSLSASLNFRKRLT